MFDFTEEINKLDPIRTVDFSMYGKNAEIYSLVIIKNGQSYIENKKTGAVVYKLDSYEDALMFRERLMKGQLPYKFISEICEDS